MSFYRFSRCFTAIKTSFHGNSIVSMKYSCYILGCLKNKYNNDYDNDYRMESDLWQAAINIPKGERKTDAGTGGAGILILDR